MSEERRRSLRIVLVSGLVVLGVCAALLVARRRVGEDEARRLATQEFVRYTQGARIDPSVFVGPAPARATNVPYGFEWTYSDEQGQVVVYVWVEESGSTDVAIDGNTDRLRRAEGDR